MFYSLTWAHKVRFPRGGVSSNPKKKIIDFMIKKNAQDSSYKIVVDMFCQVQEKVLIK